MSKKKDTGITEADTARRTVQADAMRQMRAAREAIGPAVLDRARDLILKGSTVQGAEDAPVHTASGAMADEPVDRVRTLTVLKEFLLLKRDNKRVCGEVRNMLTDRN